ncbi:sterol desaturase family protein [Caenibius sp. WL]|uniref:sterol desaturase family protein n=1 Tax=Caenibius sp. WL TaxID=2872646 RepID=UPI001C99CD44|nr:sterol desaturase family protein [Caenibius sp. WL]QZP08152.1 sterol desaturase family protein [Caenibius sp. WL]
MDQAFIEQLTKSIEIYGFGGAIFLTFVLSAEMLLRRREGKSLWSREGLSSLALFPLGPVLEGVFINAALIGGLTFFYNLSPLRIPVTWWSLPIYFLAAEFAYYWFHRLGHEVRLFWADHSIHHSAETYDFTVNLRHVPFQAIYRLLIWIPIVMLGFNPLVLVLMAITAPAFQTFCHTTRIGRLAPWFEWLFVTPRNHGVHHACNPIYIDKNYGGLLMIWDHVFGTYQAMRDDVPPVYGITHPLESNNPFKVMMHEFTPLFRDFRGAPTWRQKLGVLFGRPGETFEMPRPVKQGSQLVAEPAE